MRHAGLIAILLFLSGPFTCIALEEDSTRNDYIHSYSQYLFVGPLIKKNNLDFDIISADDIKKKYKYKANHSVSLGFNVNLFDVNVGVAFSVPLDVKSEQLFGSSDVTDLQLTAIGKKWFADVYYQKYDGFYVQPPDVVIPAGQPFPRRPDLSTLNYGMSFAYVFNSDKFSLRAPYLFSERQKVSKGSLLLSYVLSSFSLAADSALIPTSRWTEWGGGAPVNQVRFTSLGIAPGYSHTFVVKKYFLNLTLVLGPAYYWLSYQEVATASQNDPRLDFYSAARIGIGYNGDRFFTALSLITQGRNVTYERTTFHNNIATFRLVSGYRFKEVGFLKKRIRDIAPGKS